MADDKKPQNSGGQEADASDLLSLWGTSASSQPAKPMPAPELKPEPTTEPTLEPNLAPAPMSEPMSEPMPAEPALEPDSEPWLKPQSEPASESAPELAPRQQEPQSAPAEEAPPEPLEGEIMGPPPPPPPSPSGGEGEFLPENENGFHSQLDEFLAELHLQRKHVYYGIGCLALVIVLIFGGIYGVRYLKNTTTPPLVTTQPSPEISKEETGISSTTQIGATPVVTPDLIGPTGITSTVAVGTEFEGLSDIAAFLMTFRRMQNAYATNVDELLSKATDRRAKLQSYLALLRQLNAEGSSTLQKVIDEENVIGSQYDVQQQKQNAADANFFEQANALNAKTAQDVLGDFIAAGQESVALRAHYKALQTIQSYYEQGQPRLASRIRGIELNAEALIAGIKIYQVTGSDLNLILPDSNQPAPSGSLQDSPSSRASSTGSGGGIPFNPAQIKTEKDFITQPGGGLEGTSGGDVN